MNRLSNKSLTLLQRKLDAMSKTDNKLFSEFSPSDKNDWYQVAGNNLEKYRKEVDNSLFVEPYYDLSDLTQRDYLNAFQNRLYSNENWPRYWDNLQLIKVNDTLKDNLEAKKILQQADGIVFDIRHHTEVDYEKLLKNIIVDQYNISFKAAGLEQLLQYLKYLADSDIEQKNIQASFSFDSGLNTAIEAFKISSVIPTLRVIKLTSNAERATMQLAEVLKQAVQVMDQLYSEFSVMDITRKMLLTLPVSTDYFLEMAKLRAARMLFFQLCRSYGEKRFQPEDIHIHAYSPAFTDQKYQPHANLLKSTTAAMSAILGGCNSLLLEPEDIENPLMARLSRNISTILCEESYLDKNSDPVAGSYFIETLTDQLAQQAWKQFQQIMSEK